MPDARHLVPRAVGLVGFVCALISTACAPEPRRQPMRVSLRTDSSVAAPTLSAADSARLASLQSPAHARRADSLAALDPVAEADHAVAIHDVRLLGICAAATGCIVLGVPQDSIGRSADSAIVRQDGLRTIPGMADPITSVDVARFNRVADDYMAAYNARVWHHLRDGPLPAKRKLTKSASVVRRRLPLVGSAALSLADVG